MDDTEGSKDWIDDLIQRALKRQTVFEMIEPGSARILDIGYGDGGLLARLHREKECSLLYGIERNPLKCMDELLDGNWSNIFPEEPLDDSYLGYFQCIIMHDVIEHVHDPWRFLSHVRRYLASDGKMILVTPNMQYWDILHALINGDFPYGCGGLMNEDHIRWYTMKSFVETALLGGLKVERAAFMLGRGTTKRNLEMLQTSREMRVLELPPLDHKVETRVNPFPSTSFVGAFDKINIQFQHDVKHLAYQYLATKLLLVCTTNTDNPDTRSVSVAVLGRLRQEFAARYGSRVGEFLPKSVDLLSDI